jgi:hypothetical protein
MDPLVYPMLASNHVAVLLLFWCHGIPLTQEIVEIGSFRPFKDPFSWRTPSNI